MKNRKQQCKIHDHNIFSGIQIHGIKHVGYKIGTLKKT